MWTFSKRGFLTLIALIWIAILGVISPAWFSIGVVLVTGTSKGIGVSLGSEGNLYFCAGVVILVLGLVIFTINLSFRFLGMESLKQLETPFKAHIKFKRKPITAIEKLKEHL